MPAIDNGKFVILGSASQVGTHIAAQLLHAQAREVVLFDNLSMGTLEPLQGLLADPRCRFVRGDVMRLNELVDVFEKADGVFAVAGIMATNFGENPWNGIDVNLRGLQNALEACRYQQVRKIVMSSSVGVYGVVGDGDIDEESPLNWASAPPPMALYCASKAMGESLAKLYRQKYGLDFVALRYSAVYGEHQHGRALVGKKIADACVAVRQGSPVVINGDGRQVQDYLYAGDAARANLLAMESEVAGEAFNICAGVGTSEAKVMQLVGAACGAPLHLESREVAGTARLPARTELSFRREKAQRMLGWEPLVGIEEGVARVARWTESEQVANPKP